MRPFKRVPAIAKARNQIKYFKDFELWKMSSQEMETIEDDMAEKMEKSGFDYYLDLLQESKERTRREAPRKIFHLLEVNGGEMQLYELISESLPKEASDKDVGVIVETIKSLQDADLIVLESLEENAVQAKSSESTIVRVTEAGKKVMLSGFAS